jgi:hypothetical protein
LEADDEAQPAMGEVGGFAGFHAGRVLAGARSLGVLGNENARRGGPGGFEKRGGGWVVPGCSGATRHMVLEQVGIVPRWALVHAPPMALRTVKPNCTRLMTRLTMGCSFSLRGGLLFRGARRGFREPFRNAAWDADRIHGGQRRRGAKPARGARNLPRRR